MTEANTFKSKLETQRSNSGTPAINLYLNWLYGVAEHYLHTSKSILEIGAGAGISEIFFNKLNVTRTDLLNFEMGSVQGNVNCENLQFNDKSFISAFGMDVLHHIPRPVKALEELKRVVSWDSESRIVFIEPYVSFFSYLPYKLFHEENTTLTIKTHDDQPLVNESPEDGNQTIPRWLFDSKKGMTEIEKCFPASEFQIDIYYLSWFAFYFTGGLTRPFAVRPQIIQALIAFENKIPQKWMKFLASRMLITIKRHNHLC